MTQYPQAPLALFLSMPAGDHSEPAETVSLAAHDLLPALQQARKVLNETPAGIICLISSANTGNHTQSLWLMDSREALKVRLHPHARLYQTVDNIEVAREYRVSPNHGFAALWQLCHSLAARDLPPTPLPIDGTASFSGNYWFCGPGDRREVQLYLEEQDAKAAPNARQCLTLAQGSALLPPRPITHYWLEYSAASAALLATQLRRDTGARKAVNDGHAHNTLPPQGIDCRAVVVADNVQTLESELNALIHHIESRPSIWLQTPAGSCYCPANQGAKPGEVAFIYPGVGTVWAGMYQNLHLHFPDLFEAHQQLPLAEMLQSDTLQSGSEQNPSTVPLSLAQQAVAGAGQSWLLSQILTGEFGLYPDIALGYSMGEISMWASLGVWEEPQSLIQPTLESSLFSQELSGSLLAVRDLWQKQDINAKTSPEPNDDTRTPDWGCYLLRAQCEEVQQQIDTLFGKTRRVYVPVYHFDSCILAGDNVQAQAVIDKLGCTALPSPLVTAMHTPAAWHLHPAMRTFYRLKSRNQPLSSDCLFFSASQPQPLRQELSRQDWSQTIADSIADTLCQPLNFPMLITRAICQGARLFIEVGADRQLTSLLSNQQLSWQPLKPLACNSKGAPPARSLLKCIAALRALGVRVDPPLAAHGKCLPSYRSDSSVSSHSRISTTGEAPQETQYVISR
ncbi:MAG: PfaB family protein [Shewanella sp.]|nr:PfaB family protein [Shewanella sp.]MCF1429306.1 PfaB family protein [Shewanella sp.]MCF1439013.1 PfaB family protein [Shewanella sp.]MCF1456546.1 PfaB family protein [Shewanella sp.]